MNKVKVIQPTVEQEKTINKNNYSKFSIGLFIGFLCFIILSSMLPVNSWLKFIIIICGVIVIEDIHHTLKRLWLTSI